MIPHQTRIVPFDKRSVPQYLAQPLTLSLSVDSPPSWEQWGATANLPGPTPLQHPINNPSVKKPPCLVTISCQGTSESKLHVIDLIDGEKDPLSACVGFSDLDVSNSSMISVGANQVYIIGGQGKYGEPFTRVLIYNVPTSTLSTGPLLISGKARPILVKLGAVLYAISDRLQGYDVDPNPKVQYLITDIGNGTPHSQWLSVKDPPTFECLNACVDAYTSYSSTFFLSIRKAGSLSFDGMHWTQTNTELPFFGKAMYAKAQDLFYGVPRNRAHPSAFAAYQLSSSPQGLFTFKEVRSYQVPELPPYLPFGARFKFFPLEIETHDKVRFLFVCSCFDPKTINDLDDVPFVPHVVALHCLEIDGDRLTVPSSKLYPGCTPPDLWAVLN